MSMSAVPFVRRLREPQDALPVLTPEYAQEDIMRTARNLGFAFAALAIIASVCLTIEYQPLNELVR
jgi:hypothetical protein